MSNVITARVLGERTGLKHIEVIRRIRKGQINATKLDWFYIIEESEVDRVKEQDWYKRLMTRRNRETQPA